VHANLSRMGTDDGSGLKADETRAEADRAMALLDKAVGAGFRNAVQIRKDADFDGLRQRDDFKKLLQRLEPAPGFAPSSGSAREASGQTGGRSSTGK
jgi:hypothetical protein